MKEHKMAMELSALDEAGRADLTKRVSEMQRRHALAVMTLTTQEERLAYIKGIPTEVRYYSSSCHKSTCFGARFFVWDVGLRRSRRWPQDERRRVPNASPKTGKVVSAQLCGKSWRASADVAQHDGCSSPPRPDRGCCSWCLLCYPPIEPIQYTAACRLRPERSKTAEGVLDITFFGGCFPVYCRRGCRFNGRSSWFGGAKCAFATAFVSSSKRVAYQSRTFFAATAACFDNTEKRRRQAWG